MLQGGRGTKMKYFLTSILFLILIGIGSASHAYPEHNVAIWVKPFFQGDKYGTYGCAENDAVCEAARL